MKQPKVNLWIRHFFLLTVLIHHNYYIITFHIVIIIPTDHCTVITIKTKNVWSNHHHHNCYDRNLWSQFFFLQFWGRLEACNIETQYTQQLASWTLNNFPHCKRTEWSGVNSPHSAASGQTPPTVWSCRCWGRPPLRSPASSTLAANMYVALITQEPTPTATNT